MHLSAYNVDAIHESALLNTSPRVAQPSAPLALPTTMSPLALAIHVINQTYSQLLHIASHELRSNSRR